MKPVNKNKQTKDQLKKHENNCICVYLLPFDCFCNCFVVFFFRGFLHGLEPRTHRPKNRALVFHKKPMNFHGPWIGTDTPGPGEAASAIRWNRKQT